MALCRPELRLATNCAGPSGRAAGIACDGNGTRSETVMGVEGGQMAAICGAVKEVPGGEGGR